MNQPHGKLAAWMRHHADAVNEYLAANPRKTEDHVYCIHNDSLPKARKLAADLGLAMTERPMTREDALVVLGLDPREQQHEMNRRRAEMMAEDYTYIGIKIPITTEMVIATAHQIEEGIVTFEDLPGERYWTKARMDAVNFRRCDLCGKAIRRVVIFIVRRLDGSIFQAGGTCADNLKLAEQFKALREKFSRFSEWAEGMEDEPGGGFGRSSKLLDVAAVLLLAHAEIQRHGFVSTKKARESGYTLASTKDAVDQYLGDRAADRPISDPGVREDYAAMRASGTARDQILSDATAYIESMEKEQTPFANNLRAAFTTGHSRLLGLLVFIPEGMRRWRADQARRAAVAELHPYVPPLPMVATVPNRGREKMEDQYGGGTYAEVDWTVEPTDAAEPTATIDTGWRELDEVAAYVIQHMPVRNVHVKIYRAHFPESGTNSPHIDYVLKYGSRVIVDALDAALTACRPVPPPLTWGDVRRLASADPVYALVIGEENRAKADRMTPEKPAPVNVRNMLAQAAPGVWRVTRKNVSEGNFGSTYHFTLQQGDALIYWRTSRPPLFDGAGRYGGSKVLDQGDDVRILGGSWSCPSAPDPKWGANGTRLSRAGVALAMEPVAEEGDE